MGLDLDETTRILTEPDVKMSIYIKAIRLFEFQICLFCPRALYSKKETTKQKDARLFAAIKLLEHREATIRTNTGTQWLSLKALAADLDYSEIFDAVIMKCGGWARIRRLTRAREFDDDIDKRSNKTKTVAKFVDFSYRFALFESKNKLRGGITMARSVVSKAESYGVSSSRTTRNNLWREYGPSAGFLYLLHVQNFELKPPRIATKAFADRLLSQAQDRDHLMEFFQAYQHLSERLKPSGYSFPPVSVDVGKLDSCLAADPFSADVKDAIGRHLEEGDAD
jgi:hypothetical protein